MAEGDQNGGIAALKANILGLASSLHVLVRLFHAANAATISGRQLVSNMSS
eukprot:CAMPEP_0115067370 /NCGR_PEP_ID=MMETSP0227-20121206/11350_1 /TAXON_ID=89957 /ORGANISM="Polarella glacialis, Strain CCMP 1383" /LENGTH=50 /DNA_ID=CAMNT_0002453425 /DNA_START=252 /DNA_END=401 /DNA_ORIENTATION=-